MSAARRERWRISIREPIDASGILAPEKSPEWWLELAIRQQARFWSKVDKGTGGDQCWRWLAAVDKDGYGKFQVNAPRENGRHVQKHVRAHRLAWEMAHGVAPAGLVACHRCDTPACVRPAHLFLGTQADNRADCVAKGRTARGETGGNHRFTESQVRELRIRLAAGERIPKIAQVVGIPRKAIYQIANGKTWAHVDTDIKKYRPNLNALLAERKKGCCVGCDLPLPGPDALVCADPECWGLYDSARRQDFKARKRLRAEIAPSQLSLLGGA